MASSESLSAPRSAARASGASSGAASAFVRTGADGALAWSRAFASCAVRRAMRPFSTPALRAASMAADASSGRSSNSAFSARASSRSWTSATPARASASSGLPASCCRYNSSALSPAGAVRRFAASAWAARASSGDSAAGAAAACLPAVSGARRTLPPWPLPCSSHIVPSSTHSAAQAAPISSSRFAGAVIAATDTRPVRWRCSSYFLTAASANKRARPGDIGLWMNR